MEVKTWRAIGLAGSFFAGLSAAAAQDSGIVLSAQFEAGASTSFESTPSHQIFGRLFDDQDGEFVLNQALLTAAKPLDPTATGYDVGFKLQGMYGTDARYTRFTGQFGGPSDSLYQFDLVEANAQFHTPWLSNGGVDFKLGQYATPIGAETIDPSGNLFYSHSYIFNFGDPLKHTGLLAIWHASPEIDLYGSLDTGINTGLADGLGHAQNHGPPAFLGGIGLTLLGGDLTLLGLTHIGTETPTAAVTNGLEPASVSPDGAYREVVDLVTTWKANGSLTLINELNWIHDDVANNGHPVDAYGVAQYASLTVDESLSVSLRGEVFSDAENLFVGLFAGNGDFLRIEEGILPTSPYTTAGGPAGQRTTYEEISLGLTFKPKVAGLPLSTLMIRPEIREDAVLQGGHPFQDGRNRSQTTLACDLILGF